MDLEAVQSFLVTSKGAMVSLIGVKGFDILVNILSGVIGIIIYFVIYKMIKKIVNNFFHKIKDSQIKNSLEDRRIVTLNSIALSVLKYAFYFFIIAAFIEMFGGEVKAVTTVVAGVGSVAIGFGSQSLVKDVITGFFLLLEDQLAVGDTVSLSGVVGKVEAISIRTTKLRAFNGDLYTIPNGQISIVNNMSKNYKRAIVEIGFNYETNIDNIITLLEDEMKNIHQKVSGLHEVPQVLGISSFGESSVNITIAAQCDINENFRIEREIRKFVKIRLDRENIQMPYPHRTVEIIK